MSEPFWKTIISRVEPNKIVVRGYNLMDLVGMYSYADLIFKEGTVENVINLFD